MDTLIAALLLISSGLLHELGHAIIPLINNREVTIVLGLWHENLKTVRLGRVRVAIDFRTCYFFSMNTKLHNGVSSNQRVAIGFMGVTVNIIIAVISFYMARNTAFYEFFSMLCKINSILVVYNILPMKIPDLFGKYVDVPLDGYYIYKNITTRKA